MPVGRSGSARRFAALPARGPPRSMPGSSTCTCTCTCTNRALAGRRWLSAETTAVARCCPFFLVRRWVNAGRGRAGCIRTTPWYRWPLGCGTTTPRSPTSARPRTRSGETQSHWRPGLIVGHNDAASYNAAWADDRLVGFFDWDCAGLVTPDR
jgi:hypothetical protein